MECQLYGIYFMELQGSGSEFKVAPTLFSLQNRPVDQKCCSDGEQAGCVCASVPSTIKTAHQPQAT